MVNFFKASGVLFFSLFPIILYNGCEKVNKDVTGKFPAGRVMSLYIDESGIVWAGADAGIISYYNDKWKTYKDIKQIPAGLVNEISFRDSGKGPEIWLATQNGAGVIKYSKAAIIAATSYTKEGSGLSDNRINSVLTDALDDLWFATPAGLNMFRAGNWYAETSQGDLTSHPAISLGAVSDGWIFAGTRGMGVGRYKYNESIDAITGASYYDTDWSGLPSDTILTVYIDANNNQWFGTPSGAAFHTGWETKTGWKVFSVSDGLVNNRVQSVTEDKNGLIWFGTAGGASSFDGENWKNYTVSDGLADPCVNDVAADSGGTVWFATNNGISTFNGSSWKSFSSDQ